MRGLAITVPADEKLQATTEKDCATAWVLHKAGAMETDFALLVKSFPDMHATGLSPIASA